MELASNLMTATNIVFPTVSTGFNPLISNSSTQNVPQLVIGLEIT